MLGAQSVMVSVNNQKSMSGTLGKDRVTFNLTTTGFYGPAGFFQPAEKQE